MNSERERAARVYRWLWLSPLLTLPTFLFIWDWRPGYAIVCGQRAWTECDYTVASRVNLVIAILLSSLWHLLLLRPSLAKGTPFVRGHGRQALALAGIRTAVPLAIIAVFGETLAIILILLPIWFFGTLFGLDEARKGACTLYSLIGKGDELAHYREKPAPAGIGDDDVETWIDAVRHSDDPVRRRWAVEQLRQANMLEEF